MEEYTYLLVAGEIIGAIAVMYAYKALSAPKGFFRTRREHVEVKDFRRMKGK